MGISSRHGLGSKVEDGYYWKGLDMKARMVLDEARRYKILELVLDMVGREGQRWRLQGDGTALY